jgi:acetolactate synthase regulatory subunit
MTATCFEVVARTTPELLERVCRVLRHRGATVEHLVAAPTDPVAPGDPELTRLELRARCTGDVDLLVRQLRRLPDVQLIRVRDPHD